MSKRHRRKGNKDETKEQNREIRKRKSIPGKPRTKERTGPGELHKVQ